MDNRFLIIDELIERAKEDFEREKERLSRLSIDELIKEYEKAIKLGEIKGK